MKKQKPILYTTSMIPPILAGTKTETRRIRGKYLDRINESPGDWCMLSELKDGKAQFEDLITGEILLVPFNYGEIGDELWVKESFYAYGWWVKNGMSAQGLQKWKFIDFTPQEKNGYHYMDCPPNEVAPKREERKKGWYKRPSMFMPRKASRIQLKVTGRGFERLKGISEESAIAEGVEKYGPFGEYKGEPHPNGGSMRFRAYEKAARAYLDLWDSINGQKPKKNSDANPWVEVVKFEMIKER
jgi:hypothetical protein